MSKPTLSRLLLATGILTAVAMLVFAVGRDLSAVTQLKWEIEHFEDVAERYSPSERPGWQLPSNGT